ncbi:hypothetical protein GAGA_3158 [Paraglaciecola agarilytica NO2]|uniref:Uncharacterized protein n=1 Tax=Paraglaciecola agarilytica NO2 TaxID=1125747 RepID=A0ABQ0I9F3_9ALTE|nr:hypothetical protein GAGA_3158 [Paraglaciecola agarilytica NO2]
MGILPPVALLNTDTGGKKLLVEINRLLIELQFLIASG